MARARRKTKAPKRRGKKKVTKKRGKKRKSSARVGVDGEKKLRRRNAPPKRKRAAKKKPFNEKNVLAEVAADMDEDPDNFVVDEEDWPGEHFTLSTGHAEDQLRDPMQFLEDMLGREDAVKKAIEIAGIDVDAAAEDAVSTDGWPHFLARYDGNYDTTPSGFVYFRVN